MSFDSLPNDWLESEIGEIAEIVGGGTPKSTDASNFSIPGTGIAWITPADLSGYKNQYISHGTRDLTRKGYESSSAKIMPKGSLLFSSRAPIGYIAIAENEVSTNQGFKSFVFTKEIDPRYAYFYFKSIRNLAKSRGTGTTFKEISGTNAKKLPFIVAPLAEQQQIAAKLDDLLGQVDTIKTRLDTVPKILKRFRRAVLAAAVSGQLTKDWRNKKDNYEPAKMLNWKWEPVPSDWKVFYYSDLVQSRLGKMLDKAKNTGISTPYLGNVNVRWFNFNLSNIQEILVSDKEQVELMVKVGDVLICEGGEPGRCAIWKTKSEKPIIFQKALHKASVKNKLTPEWLVYNLKNDCDNNSIKQLFTGTTIKHLTAKALRKYPLRIPPIEEQTEIVAQVEQLFAFADQVEQRVKDAHKRVNHLTQSIHAKAFSGELTADWREQNPDLISGENSAEALLTKIKAEREALTKNKSTKPRVKKKTGESMKPRNIMPIIEALKAAGQPLSSQDLLAQAGYPGDVDTDQLETFFLDIREQLNAKTITRERKGDKEFFAIAE